MKKSHYNVSGFSFPIAGFDDPATLKRLTPDNNQNYGNDLKTTLQPYIDRELVAQFCSVLSQLIQEPDSEQQAHLMKISEIIQAQRDWYYAQSKQEQSRLQTERTFLNLYLKVALEKFRHKQIACCDGDDSQLDDMDNLSDDEIESLTVTAHSVLVQHEQNENQPNQLVKEQGINIIVQTKGECEAEFSKALTQLRELFKALTVRAVHGENFDDELSQILEYLLLFVEVLHIFDQFDQSGGE